MALEIKWSKRADKKFDKILEYLLTNWGATDFPSGTSCPWSDDSSSSNHFIKASFSG